MFKKIWKSKVKREGFRFYRRLKNIENEGKVGRFYILPMFKKCPKMNVKPKDFQF